VRPTRTNPCGEWVIQLTLPCLLLSVSMKNVVEHRPGAQICVENRRYNSVLSEKIPLLTPCCSFGSGYCHIQEHSV